MPLGKRPALKGPDAIGLISFRVNLLPGKSTSGSMVDPQFLSALCSTLEKLAPPRKAKTNQGVVTKQSEV